MLSVRFLPVAASLAVFSAPIVVQAQSAAPIEVFFSQVYDYNKAAARVNPESIDRKLGVYIDGAERTLDVAVYELHNDVVTSALIRAKLRGVKVRVLGDAMYRWKRVKSDPHVCPQWEQIEREGIETKYDTKTSYMHNKFYVRDGKCVWTGSFNPIDADAYENHNNSLKICNDQIAATYAKEFEEMFVAGKFGIGSPANTSKAPVTVGDATVEVCFAPEDNCGRFLVNKLLAAKTSIHIMAFSLTNFIPRGPEKLAIRKTMPTMKSAILDKKRAGLTVQAVFENMNVFAKESIGPDLIALGAPVKADSNPGVLHSKTIIIDGTTVITGSFNFSGEAENGNDENVVVVTGARVASQYMAEFRRIFDAGKVPTPPKTCDPNKKVDINSATLTDINNLPGMGWEGAAKVRDNRPYATIDELVTKKVMTKAKFNRIKNCLKADPIPVPTTP
ncbi:MAG: DUF1669 domain-containing protein [Deltaproteobacteria bacterium]|nr:DUF1669 domain-containing protein [Deltaproteobacteria bacterium]